MIFLLQIRFSLLVVRILPSLFVLIFRIFLPLAALVPYVRFAVFFTFAGRFFLHSITRLGF